VQSAVRVQGMRHSEERRWPWSTTKRRVRRVVVGISAAYGGLSQSWLPAFHYMRWCLTIQTTPFWRSDSSEDPIDLFTPGQTRCLADDRSLPVQHDDRGRTNDTELPDQLQVGLGVDVDVRNVVQPRADVSQQRARRAAGAAERTRELHERRSGSEIGAEVISGQGVAAPPMPKASVREHTRHGASVRATEPRGMRACPQCPRRLSPVTSTARNTGESRARLHRRGKEVAGDEDQRPGQDERKRPRQAPCR